MKFIVLKLRTVLVATFVVLAVARTHCAQPSQAIVNVGSGIHGWFYAPGNAEQQPPVNVYRRIKSATIVPVVMPGGGFWLRSSSNAQPTWLSARADGTYNLVLTSGLKAVLRPARVPCRRIEEIDAHGGALPRSGRSADGRAATSDHCPTSTVQSFSAYEPCELSRSEVICRKPLRDEGLAASCKPSAERERTQVDEAGKCGPKNLTQSEILFPHSMTPYVPVNVPIVQLPRLKFAVVELARRHASIVPAAAHGLYAAIAATTHQARGICHRPHIQSNSMPHPHVWRWSLAEVFDNFYAGDDTLTGTAIGTRLYCWLARDVTLKKKAPLMPDAATLPAGALVPLTDLLFLPEYVYGSIPPRVELGEAILLLPTLRELGTGTARRMVIAARTPISFGIILASPVSNVVLHPPPSAHVIEADNAGEYVIAPSSPRSSCSSYCQAQHQSDVVFVGTLAKGSVIPPESWFEYDFEIPSGSVACWGPLEQRRTHECEAPAAAAARPRPFVPRLDLSFLGERK